MKNIFSVKIFFIVALFFFLTYIYSQIGFNHWWVVESIDQPKISQGWGEPQRININTDLWEGGVYISGDGHTLFYSYYPGDLITDTVAGKLKTDIDIYYSEKPFDKAKIHALSESKWSEDGAMMSGSDIYYSSDRNHFGSTDLYKNGQVLIATLDKSEQNPHYCSSLDELYFDLNGLIYVYKDEMSTALPFPINDENQNIQPFLTKDCGEIYFSSIREGGISKIMKSKRLADNSWELPEVVVTSQYGVNNPSLTDDGNILFFVQILKSAKGVINADILYAESL